MMMKILIESWKVLLLWKSGNLRILLENMPLRFMFAIISVIFNGSPKVLSNEYKTF